jgi:predicted RNA-binding protein Jag
VQIHIEVNDYLEKKDAKLISFIQNKIEQIEISGKEIILPFFSSYERKKVHSYVS